MAETLEKNRFLVDPDLLVPDTVHVSDSAFWERLNDVSDSILEFGVVGESTGDLVDEFYLSICELGVESVTSGCISSANFWNSYACTFNSLTRADRVVVKQEKATCIVLDANVYSPEMGHESCRMALELDLANMPQPLVLADKESWSSFDGAFAHFSAVGDIYDVKKGLPFCARLIISESPSYALCKSLSGSAFPNLVFCKEAWEFSSHFMDYELDYAPKMLVFYSGLNDYACEFWQQTVEASERESRLKAKNVNCSPEKTETMQIDSCRKERTFHLDDNDLDGIVMSWHLKFIHDRGRLYFKVEESKSRVIIGGNMKHGKTNKSGVHRKRVRHRGHG